MEEENMSKEQISVIVSVLLSALVAVLRAFGYDVRVADGE